ncbi:ribosomal protein S17 [Acrasis kona]|uniref:Ribosomal protein S17 n=1 Tax=Acrasis kona TaxID=1008807 RepID=A0AAW2Z9P4_9EUKA
MVNMYVGRVLSRKMQKTGVIRISTPVYVPKYKIWITRQSKLFFHDPNEETHVGDEVQVAHFGKKISKNKSFILDKIIQKNPVVANLQREVADAQNAERTFKQIEEELLGESVFKVKINQRRRTQEEIEKEMEEEDIEMEQRTN